MMSCLIPLLMSVRLGAGQADPSVDAMMASGSNRVESVSPRVAEVEAVDWYCGPRCVHFVLSLLGSRERDLVEYINEFNWTADDEGVSLLAISELLQREGVHTIAYEGRSGFIPVWPHPAILHVHSHDLVDRGHFVVLMPNATRSSAVIWDGPRGSRRVSTGEISTMIKGGVLLTSPDPISEIVEPFVMTADEIVWRISLAVMGAWILLAMVVLAGRHQRISWWRENNLLLLWARNGIDRRGRRGE